MTMTAPTPAGSGADTGAVAAPLPLPDALRVAEEIIRESLAATSFTAMDDDGNVESMDGFERVGRLIDAGRVGTAHQVEERSARHLGRESLAWKRGCKSGRDLITRVTGVSGKEAARRINLGNRVEPRPQGGTVLPPLFPAVNAALTAGLITLDQADVIVNGLSSLTNHCTPGDLAAAEGALIASAIGAADAETPDGSDAGSEDARRDEPGDAGAGRTTGFAFSADLLRIQVGVWKARLDPDGTAPNEEPSEARSNFGFGGLRNGLYPLRGGVTPEMRGVLNGLFDTYLSAHAATPSFPSKKEQATFDQIVAQRDQDIENREGIEAGEIIPGAELDTEFTGPARPIGEKRADILRAALECITRDADTPTLGGAAPTVMVHVNAADLASGTGVGWVDGVEDPINLKTVRQMMCAGGYQTIVFGDDGDILHLGGKQRCFTTNQRKAIIARDGGCIIPGCNAPTSWVELHHVTEWAKGGPTDITNGVALCWYHHHSIETSGWKIRIVGGVPQIKAPYWMDPTQIWRHTNTHRANRATDPANSRPGSGGNPTRHADPGTLASASPGPGPSDAPPGRDDPGRTGQGTTAPTGRDPSDGPPSRE